MVYRVYVYRDYIGYIGYRGDELPSFIGIIS